MIGSLRLRFFVVVWILLVTGLVGLGALLNRWSAVEINRISSEARTDLHVGDAGRLVANAVLLAPDRDSTTLSAVLATAVAGDSLLIGAYIADSAGRIVASALPPDSLGRLTPLADGAYQFEQIRGTAQARTVVRLAGKGDLLDPRDSLDPRYLVMLPAVRNVTTQLPGAPGGAALLESRIRLALIIGSVLAALVTLAISGPLLGRVGELARATTRLRGGDRSVRVKASGRDEVAQLGRAFNAMAEELDRSERQRQQMIVDIAHELRTPLTNFTGLLEAVEDGLRPADAELIAALHEESELLRRLVDDLRDLSLADAGQLALQLEMVPVQDAVRRTVEGFDRRHGIVVTLAESPALIQADPVRFGQVLRNLLQNASTHSPTPGSVAVAVGWAGDRVTVSVTDHGPGMSEEVQARIWERFYRADPSRSRETGGMGLGLPLARRWVELMGGTISVASAPGQGAVFTVTFPGVAAGMSSG